MSHLPATLGGLAIGVVDVIGRLGADPAAGQAPDDFFLVDVDEERLVDVGAALGEHLVERLCLRTRAWKAVEDDAVLAASG